MTAIEYLSRAYLLDRQINGKLDQIQTLNELATKCTSLITGMPKAHDAGTSGMSDIVARIIDIQNDINNDIDELIDVKQELQRAINKIDGADCRTLLELRYLCNKSWKDIARELSCSVRNVYYIHERAISQIKIPF